MPSLTQQDVAGDDATRHQQTTDNDLEGQGVANASRQVDQYGAVPMMDKEHPPPPSTHDSKRLLHVCVGIYAAFFAINMVVDIAYFCTVDARFPPGLGHLYPSEWERLQSVKYTREAMIVGMLGRSVIVCFVLALVYFEVYAKVDRLMHFIAASVAAKWEWLTSSIAAKWESSCSQNCCGRSCNACCSCFRQCLGKLGYCCCMPCRCCMAGLSRCCGKCCSCCSGCCSNLRSWRELLFGSVYILLFAACLILLKAPFAYWIQAIDLKYGFANALVVTKAAFIAKLKGQLLGLLISGIPAKFIFLAVLQFRFGWLFMWLGMTIAMVYVQFNMSALAPMMMDMRNTFPTDIFGVGRGFPLASTAHAASPWVSLNRIYYKDDNSSALQFSTRDKNKGQLVLHLNAGSNSWEIASKSNSSRQLLAEALAAVSNTDVNRMLENFDAQTWNGERQWTWSGQLQPGRVGMRSGAELRDKLFGFARERNISIAEIYMVDGSHKDMRANAFVGGMHNSIIGLYDTLFLGQHADDLDQDTATNFLQELSDGNAFVLEISEKLQDVDNEDESQWHLGLSTSAPIQAMTDDEIIAILGHELAHPALGHLGQTMWTQSTTSFLTFAAMGWAAHSPLLAAAFSLAAPLLHVGVCVYDHMIGPSLTTFAKFFSDWLVRRNEYQADAYVAKMSPRYGTALQTALAKLAVNTNQDPDMPAWYEALHSDHPSVAQRWAAIDEVKQEMHSK